jgi:hypothetical protein
VIFNAAVLGEAAGGEDFGVAAGVGDGVAAGPIVGLVVGLLVGLAAVDGELKASALLLVRVQAPRSRTRPATRAAGTTPLLPLP